MSAPTYPRVQEIMSTNVIQINDDDSVEFVINLFHRCKISGAPVVNEKGEYVGVISKTDLSSKRILDWLKSADNLGAMLVKDIMSQPTVYTLAEGESVVEAVKLMREKHVHRVFVIDNEGKITGVVSSLDVVKLIETEPTFVKTAGHNVPGVDVKAAEPAVTESIAVSTNVTPPPVPSVIVGPDMTDPKEILGERIMNLVLKKQREVTLG